MSNKWYNFTNKSGAHVIDIMQEIGDWGVTSEHFRNQFKMIGESEPVTVHINSPGGDIIAGNEIYNTLKAHRGEVTIELGALCASIATVIACAGKTVTAAGNTMFMVHNPFVVAMGDSDEMRKMADIMDKMKSNIIKAYCSKTGKSEAELSAMMDSETWMSAEEAKGAGFVDSIREDDADEGDAKNFNLSRFKNSASYISRLQNKSKPSVDRAGTGDGNVPPVVSLADLEAATQLNSQPKNKIMEKTPEQINAEIRAEADKLFKARIAREKEIKDLIAAVKDRDKKDFTALADKYLADDSKSITDLYKDIATSKEFKAVEVVGSGIEVIEPLDSAKGSVGHAVVSSEKFRAVAEQLARNGHSNFSLQVNVPTFRNGQTSSGLTSIEKLPGVVELGLRPLKIRDLIAAGATNNTTIRYIQETAYANAGTSVTETGNLPELGVTYAEVDAAVKDIGGFFKVSENLMADYLAVASLINSRLQYNVERTVEDQLLNGAGAGSDLVGILASSGVQTHAKGADTAADAIRRAITKVEWTPNAVVANAQGGYPVDGIVINPSDWETLRLAKDTANQYYGGGPFTGAYGNGGLVQIESFWGKPVAVTPVIAQGTALVGSFRMGAQYFQRQGLTVEMTNSNGTDFIARQVTIRGAERLALAVYLPFAFCQVTGL